ncbi:hypothetical protein GA0061078_1445 [Bifidobacterium bohemicum]|uniref:Uncharacterized protein n=1 Tax=Bifidobacterium bohemicum DSM 22767 TaxID=1437606 RepID=A0A086ZH29_9BIFI|nr:hypothetical protein [Bifidobacterium bohemicum]KFI45829.1 hypothetical protein BBOH_0632 [Bifidobacterium bohemicum DSM 22767]SCC09911.1 hypothetical protein GA0061078_1445 [Bifidobacterium bohemicum]
MAIKSSGVEAQGAIAELTGLDASEYANQSVDFSSSTVPSMLAGQLICNALMGDTSNVVSCVLTQANKFPQLAHVFEERDQEAARDWKGQ